MCEPLRPRVMRFTPCGAILDMTGDAKVYSTSASTYLDEDIRHSDRGTIDMFGLSYSSEIIMSNIA